MRIDLSIHQGVNYLLSHISYKSEMLEDQVSIYIYIGDVSFLNS